MPHKVLPFSPQLNQYVLDHSLREPEVLQELRAETQQLKDSNMQIAPEQGQFLQLLIKLMDARNVLEVGTFTGYSSLSMALALPANGHIQACDVSEEWTAIARKYWKKAGVAEKINLHLAPAKDTLQKMVDQGTLVAFDLAFIDADKENYDMYYEQALQLLRVGGLIVVDNTLWDGDIIDEEVQDADTKAIRAFNAKVHQDERVDISMLSVADGITLLRKR